MLIGIIGDVHSNIEALTATYKALRKAGCEKIICTGDIVGYNASPKECIDFIREKEIPSVRGNHDHFVAGSDESGWNVHEHARAAILWTREILDKERISWLASLPFKYEYNDLQFVHASLEDTDGEYWPYIMNIQSAMFHFFMQKKKICFYGHTHVPLIFVFKKGFITIGLLKSSNSLKGTDDTSKILLNPGSVGQPRDFDPRASSIVFDTEKLKISLVRVRYDYSKTQDKILEAGLPTMLAERLSHGI